MVLSGGDGRWDWTSNPAATATLTQAITVPAATSTTTTTATSTTVVTTSDVITDIRFGMAWQNQDISSPNDNRLVVSYNGVTYATFESFEAGTANAAGLTGTWTYQNGASGPATTSSVADEVSGALTNIVINLPGGITASGNLTLAYQNGSTGAGSDDIAIDNVQVTSTRTTITTTTTADTADNDWTANYTENGSPVSIADADSSIFDNDDTNMESATITLTNPYAGDRLLVNGSATAGGTLPSGIAWTRTDTTVTLSGSFSKAEYADAIELVQFENTTDSPSTTPRTIQVIVNDGPVNSNTAVATINVTAVNDAPTSVAPAAVTLAEDNTLAFTGGNLLSVADLDGSSLSVTLSVTNGTLSLGTLAGLTFTTGDGTSDTTMTFSGTQAALNTALASLGFAPAADYNGAAALTFTTSDGVAPAVSKTVALTVTAVADIVDDTVSTSEDTAVSFNAITGVGGGSADSFENAGRAVTSVTQGANGTVTFTAAGLLTYTPNANFNGTDTFSYTVTSGGVTETATVTVNVTAVNDPPTSSAPAAVTTAEDTHAGLHRRQCALGRRSRRLAA